MIVALFCVPSFAVQGDVIPADDSAFIVGTPILTATAQTADLQENPTVDIVTSLMNDSLNLDLKSEVLIITPRGKYNSTSPRSVVNLSTVGTYEELFTILTYDESTNQTFDLNDRLNFPFDNSNTLAVNLLTKSRQNPLNN